MTTSTYKDYPFTSNGVNFISRVYDHSPMSKQISSLPAEVFIKLNADAINDLLGNASLMTKYELEQELERINHGGTHAFILLGENS
jgi:hypothetical protein